MACNVWLYNIRVFVVRTVPVGMPWERRGACRRREVCPPRVRIAWTADETVPHATVMIYARFIFKCDFSESPQL
ncbi:hypothetical protein BpHYR1_047563 [Brachionus plicatilis]|uniref:Uncharacterized protein n=1 Tax=Brachionus plicatilis TaxID=10195 RepID=A0A3M7SRZ1_BRAPC|nr:hypothetical protein BpHYR1_047563 [Brachionus plicatilis]